MKITWIASVMLSLLFACPIARAQNPKPLTELKPTEASNDFLFQGEPFALGGKVMHFGLGGDDYDEYASVYDLGGKYTRFEAWVGIADKYSGMSNLTYSVRLDGKEVLYNGDDPMKSFDPPKHIVLDVTGIQSMRLYGKKTIFYGEPVLYKASSASSTVAILVAPQDGATVSASSVSLLWEPVTSATGYGVEIVCTKGNSPRIYALNATNSTAKFDLTGVANGEYHWSVIAFNGKGVMGKFSKDRAFTVAR